MAQKKSKSIHHSLAWGIASILVGLVFLIRPNNVLEDIIYLLGILLIIGGIIQFLGFLARTKGWENRWKYLPLASVLSVAFGILLLANPPLWKGFVFVLFGISLVLLAVNQLIGLIRMQKAKQASVHWGYFIFPSLMFMAGAFVFFNPFGTERVLVIFAGAWLLAYGLLELFSFFSLHSLEARQNDLMKEKKNAEPNNQPNEPVNPTDAAE